MPELPRPDLSARIERLPFGRFHWHLLLMGGLGYTFDGLDAAIVSFVLPVLRPLWSLSSLQVGFLGSGTYIGYLFGALSAGLLGDRIGRRAVMMYALVLYCAASLVSAFAQDWTSFLGCRIVAGFGTGAESAIVRRSWPSSWRPAPAAASPGPWRASSPSASSPRRCSAISPCPRRRAPGAG